VRERYRYRVDSFVRYKAIRTTWEDIQRGLALPEGKHERARAMALEWRQSGKSDRQIVDTALAYFRQQPFYYTLTPPVLTGDKV
ncbi:MAG: DUF3488 domain-containing protein, partial [Xanthomonadales bacterium]|nr:DUF3488 domain-containing protein [Xanthomonadales bacterium]NIP75092.1 DUF3488 domain-containing protein [Xanthomonadales bacterium]NIQ36832.1 DUF3488 domain-containing protein [Xanthomonadales bacterium]